MAPLLRNRFLGGSSFGALMAADGVTGGGTSEAVVAAPPAPAPSESAGAAAAAVAVADSAAGASPGAPAAASEQAAAPAAPEGAAPAKPESAPTSMLAEAKAKPPGEAEAAKPDAPAAEAKPDADKPAPAEPKKDEAAPAAKPEGEAAPAKEAPAEKPPAQAYEAFKLPEGVQLDADKTKSFTSILDNPEFKPQDRAQALIDLHLAEVTRIQKEATEHQQTVWKQFQQANIDEIRKDAEFGGNRIETSLGRAKWVIEQYGGTAEQQSALLNEISYTGMGNSVRMTRLLNNIAEVLSEGDVVPAAPIAVRTQQSRKEKFYPSMQQGNGKTV